MRLLLSTTFFMACMAATPATMAQNSKSATPAKPKPDAATAAMLKAGDYPFEITDNGNYQVTISWTKEKRSQLVFIGGQNEDYEGTRILEIYSPAAKLDSRPLTPQELHGLLADSGEKKIGAWDIRDDVLFFHIRLPANITAKQLSHFVDLAAEVADNQEKTLTPDKDEL